MIAAGEILEVRRALRTALLDPDVAKAQAALERVRARWNEWLARGETGTLEVDLTERAR